MSYKDNPLFVSYGLNYGDWDDEYHSGVEDYTKIGSFWSAVFDEFPREYNVEEILSAINEIGFHILSMKDPADNFRGWLFPSEKERLLFSLKYGV